MHTLRHAPPQPQPLKKGTTRLKSLNSLCSKLIYYTRHLRPQPNRRFIHRSISQILSISSSYSFHQSSVKPVSPRYTRTVASPLVEGSCQISQDAYIMSAHLVFKMNSPSSASHQHFTRRPCLSVVRCRTPRKAPRACIPEGFASHKQTGTHSVFLPFCE